MSAPSTPREVRQAFLEFFQTHGHQPVLSGPLVPPNDPTLMFANAGMVQFKDVFTGKDRRPYQRACSSQKCIRISGKHNDLENVGVTARHHTFFEMLGNFSFGDYFKADAIKYAWEFITGVLQIPRDRLVVTVFGGEGDLPADDEAARLWRDISGLSSDRILRAGAADNFWQMGDTGPCGPCSEIHYFHGDGKADPAQFGDQNELDGTGWVELWNLVFMQFDRQADGTLVPLPAPSIDTGAGLERLSAVVQGVRSNYDTGLLRPIVDLAAKLSGKTYGRSANPDDVSMRVIADHSRATAFLIAEGIFPDREGRSYVLRRVMRRAIRHGHRLGIQRLFFHECALQVATLMGPDYPELVERKALIEEVVRQEEERFRRTLQRGLELLETNKEWLPGPSGKRLLPGKVAFTLYDTFGFPLDLQEVIGAEQEFEIDHAAFEGEMDLARQRSAGSKVGSAEVDQVYRSLAAQVGATEFGGYDTEIMESEVAGILVQGKSVAQLGENERGEIITRRTPFYAESGGQIGDTGLIRSKNGLFHVEDTQRPIEGLTVHRGAIEKGVLRLGDAVTLEVNHDRRSATRRNHSATHLLHFALRKVLGAHAMQKGSLVAPDRLRFDYSGSRPLESSEIQTIEDLVNEKILMNVPIETEVLAYDQAKQRGAIGIFEEKYGDVVRVLRMTDESVELCGGTHAFRTGDIGFFKILSESGVAAGVRRIEAATGKNAIEYVRSLERELQQSAGLLKATPMTVHEKAERLLAQQRELNKEIEQLRKQLVSGAGTKDLTSEAKEVNGARVLGAVVVAADGGTLREMADALRDRLAPAVVLLGAATKDGRALLVCTVSKDLTKRFHAGQLVKQVAEKVGGSGGGRPDFAQAGGNDPANLAAAVRSIHEILGAPTHP